MTVDNLNRRIINSDKEKIFFRKSKKKIFGKIINDFRNDYYW